MKIGQCFQVRFFVGNVVHSYHVKVVRFCNNAHLCLKLLMPGETEKNNVDREPRVKVEKKEIKITLQDGKQKIPVTLGDISISGAQLVSLTRLGNINDEFNIELAINEGARAIRLPCKIRYVHTIFNTTVQSKEMNFHHGVEFLHLADKAENFLLRLVS